MSAAVSAVEEAVSTLVEMGFSEERSRAALAQAQVKTADGALEFLVQNENNNADGSAATAPAADVPRAKSYRCVETGKLLRTMQDVQIYGERTGRSNFEECDVEVPALTAAEKLEKVAQLRAKIKEKREKRATEDALEERSRELERRRGGQEMATQREHHEKLQREAEFERRRKEKEQFLREKQRLRLEVAKDKGDRAADAARRRGASPDECKAEFERVYNDYMGKATADDAAAAKPPSVLMDEAIKSLQSYKVAGEGEKALQTLRKMLANVVESPAEDKFRSVNLANEAFKKRVASLVGGVALLKAAGFVKNEADNKLEMSKDETDLERLKLAIAKIDAVVPPA
jgi:hypothetical protein